MDVYNSKTIRMTVEDQKEYKERKLKAWIKKGFKTITIILLSITLFLSALFNILQAKRVNDLYSHTQIQIAIVASYQKALKNEWARAEIWKSRAECLQDDLNIIEGEKK